VSEVDGPAPNQKGTFAYYANADATVNRRGRLQQSSVFTSTTAHLDTTFDNYDIFGTAKKVVDPNGVETDRTTDARGRVLTVVSKKPASDPNEPASYTTTYIFDTRDRLTDAILPVGNSVHYEYEDGTNRLINTIQVDSSGKQQARMHLTLNVIGGKTKEEAQSCATPASPYLVADWTTKRNESFKYDAHNRLSEVDHPTPSGSKILYGYDSRGNLTGVQDERHSTANTIYTYDFLNRLKTVTQKQTIAPGPDIVTQYGYDVADNPRAVTDPNGNLTTYAYDDFRRVQTQTSPVSGVNSYTYDAAGNLLTFNDGKLLPDHYSGGAFVGHIGGSDFIAVLAPEHVGPFVASAESAFDAKRATFPGDAASLGLVLAIAHTDGLNLSNGPDELGRRLGKAMKAAKAVGKTNHVVWSAS
jgi:YD repeat-containing protein